MTHVTAATDRSDSTAPLASAVTPTPIRSIIHPAWPALGGAVLIATAGRLPTLCPFRICTGHACPGCGMTRGLAALARGDVSASWALHPMAVVIAAQAAVITAWLLGRHRPIRSRPPGVLPHSRAPTPLPPTLLTPTLLALNGLAFTAVWIARWATATLPA